MVTPKYQEEVFELEGARGESIHCVLDYVDPTAPLVVIPPQYEGTVRQNLLPMLYLVNNGFRVLRFDFRYHPGNSHGPFEGFTFSTGLEDLRRVMREVHSGQRSKPAGVGLLGISVSSRLILRLLAEDPSAADVHLSLLGVVDAGATIREATGHDVQLLLRNPAHRYGPCKGLRYVLDGDRFMGDLVRARWHALDSAKEEIDRIRTSTYLIVAESDRWVRMDDYQYAYRDNTAILRQTFRIPNAGHELNKNPEAAKFVFRAVVQCFQEFFRVPDLAQGQLLWEPTITELIDLNTHERERERLHAHKQCARKKPSSAAG